MDHQLKNLSISDIILLKKEIESELKSMEKLALSNIEPNYQKREYLVKKLNLLNNSINQTIDGI